MDQPLIMPTKFFFPTLGPLFFKGLRVFAYFFYGLSILLILTLGPLSLFIWDRATAKDDPELIFSTDPADHFPWWTEDHPSSAHWATLFVSHHPDYREELFDPWMGDFSEKWSEVTQGRDLRETLEHFPAEEFWDRTADLRKEIQTLIEFDELHAVPVPGFSPYETMASFWRMRTFHRITAAYALEKKQKGQPIDDIICPMLWISNEINRRSFRYMPFQISTVFLIHYWELFPETILANPDFRNLYEEFAEHWPERLQYATKGEVLSAAKTFAIYMSEGPFSANDLITSSARIGHTTLSRRVFQSVYDRYADHILKHHFLPRRTLNTLWDIHVRKRQLLEEKTFDQYKNWWDFPDFYPDVSSEISLSPNAGGNYVLPILTGGLYPRLRQANDLASDFLKARDSLNFPE